jgi:hypothetical protein
VKLAALKVERFAVIKAIAPKINFFMGLVTSKILGPTYRSASEKYQFVGRAMPS